MATVLADGNHFIARAPDKTNANAGDSGDVQVWTYIVMAYGRPSFWSLLSDDAERGKGVLSRVV